MLSQITALEACLAVKGKNWILFNTQSTRREVSEMFEMRGSVLADDGVRLSYKRAAEGPHHLRLRRAEVNCRRLHRELSLHPNVPLLVRSV